MIFFFNLLNFQVMDVCFLHYMLLCGKFWYFILFNQTSKLVILNNYFFI